MARGDIKVLFVCTGNVYRSMSAEKCLKDYVKRNNVKGIKVDSCGTVAKPEPIFRETKNRLKQHKVKLYHHRNKKVSQKLVDWADVVVAMNKNHQEVLKRRFDIDAILFNQIAYNKNEGVRDFHEINPRYAGKKDIWEYKQKKIVQETTMLADNTIDHIYSAMPSFVDNLHKYVGKK